MKSFVAGVALTLLILQPAAGEKHPFGIDDALKIKAVRDPQISPDGQWVAYVVSSVDLEEDSRNSDVFMVPAAGGDPVQLTFNKKSDHRPRWSPDGQYLAFLSNRAGDKAQIWLMDRRGGEAFQLSSLKSGVSSYEWSPDGKKIALISHDPDPNEPDPDEEEEKKKKKKTPPIVVNRLQFKEDGEGYLNERRDHLYVLTVSDKKTAQITSGPYDDSSPAWSPDGSQIAFVSNRSENPDSNRNTDIFLVSPEGGEPKRITSNKGSDSSPAWSPDGRFVACISSLKPDLIWYAVRELRLIEVESGQARSLTAALDRNVGDPHFSLSGDAVYFLLEDGGNLSLARVFPTDGQITMVAGGERQISDFRLGTEGRIILRASQPDLPAEIFSFADSTGLRQLTSHNRGLLEEVRLGAVERIQFESADGTAVEGFVTKPADFETGRRYPAILWIHGGPVAQFSTEFNSIWQVFSGAGYVVVAANPRGSSGYGEGFSKAIWADWGNKDFQDVMAAVDHVVELGYADPDRLGVGGWSYGGILTNYVITKTGRFKAAISGASETDYLSCYGTDHYQHDWEAELGLPWENRDLYTRMSPLTYVTNIVTPTLILCGEHDWNVPLNQSEQLYQRLRRRGLDTQLIVYPGQSHGIVKPTYQKDRYERYLGWFDRLLLGKDASPAS